MLLKRLGLCVFLALAVPLAPAGFGALADDRFITVQSTTSTHNSGLYDAILPAFEAATGISVRVVSVGTGQAIKNAERCDGDVLVVHSRAREEAFVANGFGLKRHDVMYNDFVLVGPSSDPARIGDTDTASAALGQIAEQQVPFVSRGDDSGTHSKERALWTLAEIDPEPASGTWYREAGSGMGATLNIAAGMNAYTLTDRATWSSFGNKASLALLFEGDGALHNPYGAIVVNPAHCPNVKAAHGQVFVDWLTSTEGQDAIASFRPGGEQLFFPNAKAVAQ